MNAYVLTAAGVILLTVIISFIVPEGRLKKSVNFVLRIACIFILAQPISGLFSFSASGEGGAPDYEYVSAVYSQNQSKLLTEKVESEMNISCVCLVEVVYDETGLYEKGVRVEGDFKDEKTIEDIAEYLRGLGYINITVNEKAC